MNLNVLQAECARDALIKTIYIGLFDWIGQQLNSKLHPGFLSSTNHYIGILDMPGFGQYFLCNFFLSIESFTT